MRSAVLLALAFGVVVSVAVAQTNPDREWTRGDIVLKVLGQSGKIKIRRRGESEVNAVAINFDAMRELDSDGNTVGGGNDGHSFNSFASQDFTISEITEGTYDGLDSYHVEFSADINGADVVVDVYMMREAGNVTNGSGDDAEDIEVNVGDIKVTIDINAWKFCESGTFANGSPHVCTKAGQREVGAFLEFDLEMKSASRPSRRNLGSGANEEGADGGRTLMGDNRRRRGGRLQPDVWDLGDGAELALSTKVRVDDVWADMPGAADGTYPMMTQRGSKTIYTFRFPKGASLFYDPNVSLFGADDGAAGTTVSAVAVLLAAVFAFVRMD